MKTFLLPLLTTLLTGALPAAELILPTDTFQPNTTLELRFDEAMVPESEVGSLAVTSPLLANPAITGEFKWTSTRSGQFRFTKTPVIATRYEFHLAPGLRNAAGKSVPVQNFGSFNTDPFKIAEFSRDYPYGYGNSVQRTPRYFVQFNDAISAETASAGFYFTDATGSPRIAAIARVATFKDFQKRYNPPLVRTWEELAANATPVLNATSPPRPNALIIESVEPLPVGKDWRLQATPDLTNTSSTANLHLEQPLQWGSVLPLVVNKFSTENHFDGPREIHVAFNKTLGNSRLDADELNARAAAHVQLSPTVANLKVSVGYASLILSGDFALNTPYHLTISEGLPGGDDLPLESPVRETLTFTPSPVFLSTTAEASSQMARGNGILDIYAANHQSLTIRVKKLSQGELIQARDLYVASYRPDEEPAASAKHVRETPFENFPGIVVFEKELPNDKALEVSTLHHLQWSDILGETPAAPVFIELSATPQQGAPAGTIVTRAIVEFTDIGLVAKNNGRETLVYAFSLKTGQPLPNVQLTFMDGARGFLSHSVTDASGIAVTSAKETAWILAKNAEDTTAINIAQNDNRISLWGQNIDINWESPWTPRHETLLFSDRPVYKPGDTAHVKAITRIRSGDTLTLPQKPLAANLIVTDARNREILNESVTFSANGTWSRDIPLPEGNTGWYALRLVYPTKNASEGEADSAYLDLRVDEYKPNSFEVTLAGAQHTVQPDRITVPLSAAYYMGKALSKASAHWNASLDTAYLPPEEYQNYHFGDVAPWWHYGKDLDDETASKESETETETWNAYGEINLSDEGNAEINLPTVPDHHAALPQTVTVYAEVTDVNQQTISTSTQFQLPGAEFIVGTQKSSWYATAKQPFAVDFVAITPDGKPFTSPAPIEITLERQQWNTVRVESAGGAIATKNQSTLIEELKTTLTLSSTHQQAAANRLEFTPSQGGTYFLTATALDRHGKKILSRIAFYSLGGGGFPWSWEDGAKITLQPDKTTLNPGEELSVVVKTPISGKALVSVERNHIHRHFLADISPENPVIKLKAEDIDAPNAFISVILIRGADASPQPDPMPEYKVGYCAVTVRSETKKLHLDLQPSQTPVLPGGELTISALVKDAAANPVPDAEVTLYAVDEGVLSLMSYLTPDPFAHFNTPAALAVSNHTTLENLISESLAARYRGNKGIIIGGGGEEAGADAFLRKNFVATALWQGSLNTDAQGRVSTTFKVPDNLTRYRIMAVAIKDAERFGSAESSFTINKPLMLEPAVPRFAHRDDEILVKAIVHNTTPHRGAIEVELKLNDTTTLIEEERPFTLIGLKADRFITPDHQSERRLITLEPNQTAAVAFPVRFLKTGAAVWQWQAKTTAWSGDALHDAVQSTFEVTHPAPSLREVHYVSLTGTHSADLIKAINPQLLEGEGTLRLDLSQSRLTEARDALRHLLQYPYGCVEQTSSRLLPWLALSKYEPLFPELLQKDKAGTMIQRGAERLLTMQTESGGLGYWPGAEEAELWASAYGGFALVKAKEWGIGIPPQALEKLTAWISGELRGLDLAKTQETWVLNDAALALYTLAKAGKAEPAYQTTLYSRRDLLPDTARAFLALALCLGDAPPAQIGELLKPLPKSKNSWEAYWLGGQTAKGLQLIACAHLGLTKQAEIITQELFQSRKTNGHWGTTFSNAWILLGLSTNERVPKTDSPLAVEITHGGQTSTHTLPSYLSAETIIHPLKKTPGELKISVPEDKTVRGRLEIQSWPEPKAFQAVSKGFTIKRHYQRLSPLGTLEPAENLRVGDLVVTTLEIDVQRPNRYLAIEDSLPSVFEPINPEFTTQNTRPDAEALDNEWLTDHRELRHDKALFFTNDWSELGKFQLRYLARVIAEGNVIAPPAKIEAMYEPDHYGLSDITTIQTLPATKENIVKQ